MRRASPGDAVFESVAFGVGQIAAEPASVSPWPFPCEGAGLPVRFSFIEALGVGHMRTVASVSVSPWVPVVFGFPPDFRMSIVVGVGHCRAAPLSSGSAPRSPERIPFPCTSVAFGVGHCFACHEPEPFAAVRCANGCRAEQTPFRIEPELGKVMEDLGEPESNKLGDVFQQDEAGCHVSDDGCDGWPEPAVIVSSTLPAGGTERLAGEAGSDEIHSATPRATVEGGEVIPDRSLIQSRLRHPLHEDGRRVGIPLNVSHGSYPCHGSEGELESAVAGAEVEGT